MSGNTLLPFLPPSTPPSQIHFGPKLAILLLILIPPWHTVVIYSLLFVLFCLFLWWNYITFSRHTIIQQTNNLNLCNHHITRSKRHNCSVWISNMNLCQTVLRLQNSTYRITGKTLFKTYHTKLNIGEKRNAYKGAEGCRNTLNLVRKQYLKLKITCWIPCDRSQ